MKKIIQPYMRLYKQGIVPILIDDERDPRLIIDACVSAGAEAIEYTLRRRDAREIIPWIIANYPDIVLLIGSTIDDKRIAKQVQRNYPQFMCLDELADMGVSGFVSFFGMSEDTISRYSRTHLLIPSVWTPTEALRMLSAGAHFAKVMGPNLDMLKHLRSDPTFGFCPVFITGGMNIERIPSAIAAGTVLVGTGLDVMLKGEPNVLSLHDIERIVRQYISVTKEARSKYMPHVLELEDLDAIAFFSSLTHYHPFADKLFEIPKKAISLVPQY